MSASWTSVASMPVARAYGVFGKLANGRICSLSNDDPKKSFETFNGIEWQHLADDPLNLQPLGGIQLSTGDFLMVGNAGSGLRSVRFNLAANTWTQATVSDKTGYINVKLVELDSGNVLATSLHNGGSYNQTAIYDVGTDTWSDGPDLNTARWQHALVKIPDGRVLVIGGRDGGGTFSAVEIADAAVTSWTAVTSLTHTRSDPNAVVLQDGTVLVAAGYSLGPYAAVVDAELYDPTGDTWSAAGTITSPRASDARMLLMSDGKAFLAGGWSSDGNGPSLETAEIYDPTGNAWTATASMAHRRAGFGLALHSASPDIIVAFGGEDYDGDVTDFLSDTTEYWSEGTLIAETGTGPGTALGWHTGPTLVDAMDSAAYVKLGSGNIIAAQNNTPMDVLKGGADGAWSTVPGGTPTKPIYRTAGTLMDVAGSGDALFTTGNATNSQAAAVRVAADAASWTEEDVGTTTPDSSPRDIVQLSDGRVLMAPVMNPTTAESHPYGNQTRLYTPGTDSWANGPTFNDHRDECRIVKLLDGRILAIGGVNGALADFHTWNTVERADASVTGWTHVASMAHARQTHAAIVLSDGRVLVAGGDSAVFGSTHVAEAEIYDPTGNTWSSAGTMVGNRAAGHALVELPDGRVLCCGGVPDDSSTTLKSAEIWDPMTSLWTAVDDMAVARLYPGLIVVSSDPLQVLAMGGSNNIDGGLTSTEYYGYTSYSLEEGPPPEPAPPTDPPPPPPLSYWAKRIFGARFYEQFKP